MSFILDALRKSEARRQRGGSPGLNSPEPAGPRRTRRGPRPAVVLVAILVVAGAALAGVVLTQPQWLPERLAGMLGRGPEPAGEAPPLVTPPALDDNRAVVDAESAADIRRRLTGVPATSPAPAPVGADTGEELTAGTAEETGGAEQVRDRRAPRRSAAERSAARRAAQRETEPVVAEDALAEIERRVAESERDRRTPSRAPEEPEVADARPRSSDDDPVGEAVSESQSPEPRPLNADVAEYVRVWELPLAVRRSLPELNLSIHVFSPREEERFVLVNGERYMAGDTIGQGVRLVDIRREGAIVDFRSHRFLLESR